MIFFYIDIYCTRCYRRDSSRALWSAEGVINYCTPGRHALEMPKMNKKQSDLFGDEHLITCARITLNSIRGLSLPLATRLLSAFSILRLIFSFEIGIISSSQVVFAVLVFSYK